MNSFAALGMASMSATAPTVVVLAGANGAGKTTSARTILADTLRLLTFVNADVIAQGLSGFAPEHMALEAGQIMLERLRELAAARKSFAFETTLSGKSHAPWLRSLRLAGFECHLVYFWLESAELAVARVAARVRQGGHDIPEATIRRRYRRGAENFFRLYRPLASTWQVIDNSETAAPALVAEGLEGGTETVFSAATWEQLKREASYE